MKKLKPIIVGIAIAAVAAAAVLAGRNIQHGLQQHQHGKDIYYCPMHPTYTSDKPGDCPICNMALVKKEEETPVTAAGHEGHALPGTEGTGTAPLREMTVQEIMQMKPGEICLLHKCKMGKCMIAMTEEFARLGKCPHCGEDLGITIKDAVPQGYASVKIAGEKRELAGIETAPVTKRTLEKSIRTVGRVAYDPELYQAQEEYLQAIQAARKAAAAEPEIKMQAEKLVESSRIKLRLLGLSDTLIQEIEAAGKADRSLLYSDAGGKVWLYAPIYEYEIPLVKVGDRLKAEASGMAGKNFEGEIRSIDSVLDPTTRSARVRAVLDNAEGLLKPEMFVNATILIAAGEKLTIPEQAVFETGEKTIVFVAKPDGHFEPREVVLGIKTDDFAEVRSGLGEGEQVVTSGNFLIDSESRLKAALEGMSGGGGHQHGV